MSSKSAKTAAVTLGLIALAIYVAYIAWVGIRF